MSNRLQLAQEFLIQAQARLPGWGYFANAEQAFPEPTCYSLLALANTAFDNEPVIQWLSNQVNADGQFILPNDDSPNWATSHLIITLSQLGQRSSIYKKSVDWLLVWKSKYAENSEIIPLNAGLIGWSWISDTFSWVQPTSYAVLALKFAGKNAHSRVKEAETLLLDRMCSQGGWNFGNPQVLDQYIDPAIFDTTVALIALQDLAEASDSIHQSLDYLERDAPLYPSALSLAMTILCLDLYDRPVQKYVDLLLERQEDDGSWRQMIWWTAMAVLAFQAAEGGNNVFKL